MTLDSSFNLMVLLYLLVNWTSLLPCYFTRNWWGLMSLTLEHILFLWRTHLREARRQGLYRREAVSCHVAVLHGWVPRSPTCHYSKRSASSSPMSVHFWIEWHVSAGWWKERPTLGGHQWNHRQVPRSVSALGMLAWNTPSCFLKSLLYVPLRLIWLLGICGRVTKSDWLWVLNANKI